MHRMGITAEIDRVLLAFNVIPPRNISREKFIRIDVCYKCYQLDDHLSAACGKGGDYMVCSICSSPDHTFKNCNSNIKKCINCSGEHSTLAMSCPVRKKLLVEKRKNSRGTYADRAAADLRASSSAETSKLVSDKLSSSSVLGQTIDIKSIVSKTVTCILVASMKERTAAGSFELVLNQLLKGNGLEPFSMGDVEPPLFDALIPTNETTQEPTINRNSSKNEAKPMSLRSTNTKNAREQHRSSENSAIELCFKKGFPINASNIDKRIAEKKAFIVSNMSMDDCYRLLRADFGIARITELPVGEFNSRIRGESDRNKLSSSTGATVKSVIN